MAFIRKRKVGKEEIEVMDGVFNRLYSYIEPYRGRFVWAVVFGALAGVVNGLLIFLLKSVFTIVLPGESGKAVPTHFRPFEDVPLEAFQKIQIPRPQLPPEKEWIFVTVICLSVPLILAARGLFTYLHQYLMLWLNNKVLFQLRDECFTSIIRQPLSFFGEVKQGELMHSVATQTRSSADAGIQLLSAWIKHPISIVSILIACFAMDWLYTLGAFIVFPICILPVAMIARKVRKAGGREEVESEGLMVTMQESFDGIRLVKAHAREDFQRERFNRGSRHLLEWLMRWRKAMEISTPMVETVASLGISIGLVYAWVTKMEPGKFMVLNMAMVSIYPHAKALSRLHLQLQRCAVSASRVFGYIDREPEVKDRDDAVDLKTIDGPFELDDVHFSYDGDSEVIKGLSLTFEPGKKYALVGRSGSGKSTILSLMMRFYDPQSGAIKLSGRDIREFTQESLRDQIGLVSQDTFLFHDSIRSNIRYGRLDATDEEVEVAAKMARADEFIETLPEGFDTMLGDKGQNLSGGQKQRLSIARAILRNAPILFLDEAMASQDTELEKEVQKEIDELAKGKTVVAIAHRLSTILDSDEIIVMKKGRVEDRGPHSELVTRCPEYKRLYDLQFQVEG